MNKWCTVGCNKEVKTKNKKYFIHICIRRFFYNIVIKSVLGVREREVSTSLTSSVSFACLHWSPWGPARAERKVMGSPRPSRFSTGADADDEGLGAGEADSNHVGVNGEGGGRGTRG
jgi:hypothetical protein